MTDQPTAPVRRSKLTPDYQRDWPTYYDAVGELGPRETLVRALDAFEHEAAAADAARLAIDIGCGEGRDVREILRRNAPGRGAWRVVAIDSSDDGLRRLTARLSDADRARVDIRRVAMEEIAGASDLPGPGSADFINASFALPFCRPEHFPALWRWIARTLRPGGRFAGQLFGDRDEWACVRPKSHFTRRQVDELLAGYEVEFLDEVEKEGTDATGGAKHHHVYHVVARRG